MPFTCPSCYAMDTASPPHGVGNQCPNQARILDAKLALLSAQIGYYTALEEAVREPATQIPWPQSETVNEPPPPLGPGCDCLPDR